MIARQRPGLIINTGSKQGITTPPGDPAYNVSKAGLKAFTEALQHELRNTKDCRMRAIADSRFRIHRADRQGPRRETRCRLDAGADGGFHDGGARGGRFLYPMPRQRRAAPARRAAHTVGRRRHRREPPAAVALASRLCERFCGLCRERELKNNAESLRARRRREPGIVMHLLPMQRPLNITVAMER
jgi:NAD(P)-dependent dehydrogenase (short-subunit alcohol dehydrogenase family)